MHVADAFCSEEIMEREREREREAPPWKSVRCVGLCVGGGHTASAVFFFYTIASLYIRAVTPPSIA